MGRPATVDYKGQPISGEDVEFKTLKEDWNEYQLEDGSKIRVRLVVSDIILTKETTQEGEPLVIVRSATLVRYKTPRIGKAKARAKAKMRAKAKTKVSKDGVRGPRK